MANRNLSEAFEFPGREKLKVTLMESSHETYMKSDRESIINNKRTFGVHFQENRYPIKAPLFNIISGST